MDYTLTRIEPILNGIDKRIVVTDIKSYYILKEHFNKEIIEELSRTVGVNFRTKYDITVMYVLFNCLRDLRGLKIDLLITSEAEASLVGVPTLSSVLLEEVLLHIL